MTNEAKVEKNLNRIQKKLQILEPIIQDARQSCFGTLKILTTVSVSLNGGAIFVIVNNSYEDLFSNLAPFLCGLILTILGCIYFSIFNNVNLCDKYEFIFSKNRSLSVITNQIRKSKNVSLGIMFIIFSFAGISFTYGADQVFGIALTWFRI